MFKNDKEIRALGQKVKTYAKEKGMGHEECEDFSQYALMSLWRKYQKTGEEPKVYLFSLFADYMRETIGRVYNVSAHETRLAINAAAKLSDFLQDAPDVERELIEIPDLEPIIRAFVILVSFYGLNYKELGQTFGMSEDSVQFLMRYKKRRAA